jgi:hypothetical protein
MLACALKAHDKKAKIEIMVWNLRAKRSIK